MNLPNLPTFEVQFPICGMTCRVLVRARSESRALAVVRSYLTEAGMENPAQAMDSATARIVAVLDDVRDVIAAENRKAARAENPHESEGAIADEGIAITHEEKSGQYVVTCGNWELERFGRRQDAEAYVKRRNTGGNIHAEPATAQ